MSLRATVGSGVDVNYCLRFDRSKIFRLVAIARGGFRRSRTHSISLAGLSVRNDKNDAPRKIASFVHS